MISVNVKFFAITRDIVGKDEEVRSLPTQSSASSLIDALITEYPKMKEWKDHLRLAVNREYVPPNYPLHDNDEVAVIPPVSGG